MRKEVKCQAEACIDRSDPWMRNLPNQLISELTIPGTHDSCCMKDCGVLKCQNWSLAEQLSEGIRFLDIRCRHVSDSFNIHHDYMYCDMSLHNVLDTCRIFLKNFPSECLVMRVKEEYQPYECSRSFQETFKSYVDEYKDMIKTKIRKIEDHVKAALDGKKNELYLNFCSGTGEYAWPEPISKETNKIVYKFKGRFGVVVFDFPGREVIKHLIKQNKVNCYHYDYPMKFISEKNFILDVINKVNGVILLVFKNFFTQRLKNQNKKYNFRKSKNIKKIKEEDVNLTFIYKSFINIQLQITNNLLPMSNFLPMTNFLPMKSFLPMSMSMPIPMTHFLPYENFRSPIKLSDY